MHEASDRPPIGVAPSFIPRALAGALSYVFQRRGFLTSNVAESGGFVKSSPSQSRPNLPFHFIPTLLKDHGRQITFGHGFTFHVCDLLPKHRGRIGLKNRIHLNTPYIKSPSLPAPTKP